MSKPTESELEILSLLWELKEASVRQIHERLTETKDTGYTTTLKIMQIMHAKGMVTRDEENRSHIYRPAAIDQLKVLGEQVGVEVYAEPENKDAVKIAKAAIEHAKKNNHRVVIVDTAGRLAVDEEMMNEITNFLKESKLRFLQTLGQRSISREKSGAIPDFSVKF